jgi:GNAT superfamily N-acetyltransferase
MALSNQDRHRIIEILTAAFDNNQSVNYIIPQDSIRSKRIQGLMDYACRVCEAHGKVFLSSDRNSCALVLLPHKKKWSVQTLLLDISLIFRVTGLRNIRKVLRREALIHKQHPIGPFYYLWFIGVDPAFTGQGMGSILLEKLIADAGSLNLPFYLETSTKRNIPWYQRFGFRIYQEIDLGCQLLFMKRPISVF